MRYCTLLNVALVIFGLQRGAAAQEFDDLIRVPRIDLLDRVGAATRSGVEDVVDNLDLSSPVGSIDYSGLADRARLVDTGDLLETVEPTSFFKQLDLNPWNGSEHCGANGDCCPPFEDCCPPCGISLFGDFLYLSPGGVDFAYATHVDGTTAAAVPLAPPSMVDPTYQPGFRVGLGYDLDATSKLKATYWYYENSTTNSVILPGGTGFLRPELVHPNTLTVASDRLAATAGYGIDFQMADLDYEDILSCGDCWWVNWFAGVRYANLDEDFRALYTNLDAIQVQSEIDFDGVGPRIGIGGERELGCGLLVFGRASSNFIVGEFRADYRQQLITTGVTQAVTGYTDDRIVTQLELELGLGWHNCCDTFRIQAGYYTAAWLNSVTTPSFIRDVQAASFDSMSETLTFDGLTVRAEIRY